MYRPQTTAETAASGVEDLDVDAAEEAEMQQFLDRLDFEDYFQDWVSLATSVSSTDLFDSTR